ncbi:MAG TPA: NAD(P)/FAD-dependent oxidoreductase [Candidatus Limnocylindrales bacterium]|nr:NAD(P)/FAD-dependent oxidoreductase [Candidatus Limnocylindrales bacterium]
MSIATAPETETGTYGRRHGDYDVIVVGGGHNALVTAAYLAKAGQRVLVLERRERIGGAAETSELGGARVPRLAHTIGRLRPSIVRDLDLKSHGLRLLAPDARVFAPSPDGRAVTFWVDQARTVEALRAVSAHDAHAYPDFDRLVRSLGRFLGEIAAQTPPDIHAPRLDDALAGLKLGRTFRGLGKHDGRTITRVLPMAVADFVAEAFETDPVQAALAWRGVQYCSLGPWSAGSAAVLLFDAAGNDGGAAGQTVFAEGGPGALSEALASAARAAGAEIRCRAEVTAITSRDGRVTGVALSSGDEIAAAAVVSGLDPKRTLAGLSDPVAVGPSMLWRAGNYRTPGVVSKVNLVLGGLPRFTAAAGDDETRLRGRIVVAPGIDPMERAFDASKYGRVSDQFILEATIPSLVDPSLVDGAAPGTHVMSVIAQYTPYKLRDGSWDDEGRHDAVADAVVAQLDALAPGLAGLVREREVLTPLDLEREYGLSGGHPLHGEPGLDQFFLWRPFLGHARYRLPIEGLYLAGSGAHPGGGVTGQPGQNAAREILSDTKRRR